MSTGIYAVIEYAENDIYFAFNKVSLPREELLFSLLGYTNSGRWYANFNNHNHRFPPRGLPSDLSQEVREYFFVPNNYHFYLVKIEPGSVDEAQLRRILKEENGDSALNYYEETNFVPLLAFIHSVRLNEILGEETNLIAELRGVSTHRFLQRSFETLNDDDELRGIFESYRDWVSNQFKRTDLICCTDEAELKEFLKSYGDWALKEYEETNLIPDSNFHTPSWLNFNELKEALGYKLEVDFDFEELEEDVFEIREVLTAMQALAWKYGNENVRLVFWFDY